jgi:hypothetical protein
MTPIYAAIVTDQTLVIHVEDPSDELRMLLDDILTDYANDFNYPHQPKREMDIENVRNHTTRRLAGYSIEL